MICNCVALLNKQKKKWQVNFIIVCVDSHVFIYLQLFLVGYLDEIILYLI